MAKRSGYMTGSTTGLPFSDLDIESGWSDAIKNRRNHLEFAAAVL